MQIVRTGPVHFQPIEWELDQIAAYLRGSVLNAGCGDRDIGPYLRKIGVDSLTNYDIASGLAGAVLGPLEAMPFENARFETVLSNAVLEHVGSVQSVLQEMIRILRPGGHLILAVPFLQPYHQCPRDFRRYTCDGLVALGEEAGLETVAVHPVHSAAQTLGWIAWEIAKEKQSLVFRAILWPIIYLATRMSLRTDRRLLRNANTFQVVFRRPAA